MVKKKCGYRGCDSFVSSSQPSHETLYAFPKDPERCKAWMELGGCSEDMPPTMRYFCSKHFDEKKYVAHNQRRKQLLNSAVPWPYQQIQVKQEVIQSKDDYQCVESRIDDDKDTFVERKYAEELSVKVSHELPNKMSVKVEDTVLQSYEYPEVSSDTCEINTHSSSEKDLREDDLNASRNH